MSRRMILGLVLTALLASACDSNLGLAQPDCNDVELNTHFLAAQAVPTAKYTPCIDELRLGWDSVDWYAQDGEAGIEFVRGTTPFLTVSVTETCDVSDARLARSGHPIGHPDIDRFEDTESVPIVIRITIIPLGGGPLETAEDIVEEFGQEEIEDRRVIMTIDGDLEQDAKPRVDRALANDHYVWIISSLDADEKTIEMRSNTPGVAGTALRPEKALDLIEDHVPDLYFRGSWYFTFEGGCITYDFDAKGILAVTVAEDADDAIGFYPAYQLRNYFRDGGFDIG